MASLTELVQAPALNSVAPELSAEQHAALTLTTILIPDLFVSFCSQAPLLNPFYAKVKTESDEWFAQLYGTTEKERMKLDKADFALFAASWTEHAGGPEFRTICDWCNWVFYFDDQFDEGHLCQDPLNAQREADILTQIMTTGLKDDEYKDDPPRARALRSAFRSVWERLVERASKGVQARFREAMQDFCRGLVGQVGVRAELCSQDIAGYLAFRRGSIGVIPCIVFAEYYHNLRLPEEFFRVPAVQRLKDLAAEITVLHNDVLSYHKEYDMGAVHNIVIIFRQQGMTQQEAYNNVDTLIRQRLQEWHLRVSEVPIYGENIDAQVHKYLTACREVAVGNLHWSFATERYFGKEKDNVRYTRKVELINLDA
ncbi:Terpene synthase metal binding domain protein [Penicillium taxi]|uniref:Terpene synthase metal binding domain protein n=1 Tax=Penicillium taxi TaxID=168475 RepID=UPI00254558FE|nr:Terpene synthase metal binding domain protein [Penicillium taxi]KAJ5895356.1 Terpene synthase metal binding domain protein [Penicillium taxi]